ncbi:phage portal protein, HK97 family [Anaerovibrio lipolyticus DSM 3074]|uniref:Phage portal protein, HK97 family n=1 Tax=Anaerovibrio lipolyticus DSM 3074 TaxID=1120997 RepID=A0A1M6G7J4_9FIRM|nr:phage portal protein [Anaerovibrio lipolyticus]SHJ05902.1 phage portal protein, HK97 family [Anaerovibrio lipolyticus DSM 3074]
MIFSKLKQMFRIEKRMSNEELTDVLRGNTFNNTINKKQALDIPAVSASLDFIGGTIAGLPIRLYKKNGDSVEEVTDDYRLKLLNQETGDLLDAHQLFKALINDMLLCGESYCYVEHERNQIKGLFYVDNSNVSIIKNVDPIHKQATIYIQGVQYPDYEVMRLTRNTKDGLTGSGVLDTNSLLLSCMYNAMKYENTAISSGAKRGFLKSKYKLTKDMLTELKKSWRKLYSGDANSNSDVLVLNEGISFESASNNATENQLNESKAKNTALVYNLFGLSESLFDGSKSNHDTYLNAVKTAVLPVVSALECSLNKFLLLEREKSSYFFKIDCSEILKTSINDRYNSYKTAIECGFMSVDEVRQQENLPPLGMDFIRLNLGSVLYYPTEKKIYTPNTDTYTDIQGGEVKE